MAGVGDDGPGRGDGHIQVGHPMLEGLETADRAAELHSALGVFDGQLQAAFGGADLLGRQQDCCGVGDSGIGAQRLGLFGLQAGQPASGVHGGDGLRAKASPPGQLPAGGGDDDIGDVAVDHVVGVQHQRADRAALGKLRECLRIRLSCGQQRQLRQRGAQQRRRHQRPAQLLHDDRGIGEFTARAAQLLRNDQHGGTDLLT